MIVQRSLREDDLAPGDIRSKDFDWTGFTFLRVNHPDDPDFERLYSELDKEFGSRGEMETRKVLRERLSWLLTEKRMGYHMRYQMLAVEKNGRLAGLHDHTVILAPDALPGVFVHLSHIWVSPEWRRSGLAGWLRAFPVGDAMEAGLELGFPVDAPTILVAEMEPLERPGQLPRLLAYLRAGFRRVDPQRVDYHQPDFRPPLEIDASGNAQPLPLWLMVRMPGLENRRFITGQEIRQTLAALHAMYAQTFRKKDMCKTDRAHFPDPLEKIALQDTF